VPLYYQIKQDLLEKIENKYYDVGDLIPSESELQENYKVSRITIRRAVLELVHEGHLYTQQGKGTYVRKPKASQELNQVSSWAETMKELGMHPETKIKRYVEELVSVEMSKILNIPIGDKVYKIERVRYANDEPTCLMTNYLVPSIVPGFLEKGLVRESLYETLEKEYKIILSSATETVEAKAADSSEAAQLQIKRGAPLLCTTRVTYDITNRPVEMVISVIRADTYSYKIKLSGRSKNL
jgi:GntR family transcriptional regulator